MKIILLVIGGALMLIGGLLAYGSMAIDPATWVHLGSMPSVAGAQFRLEIIMMGCAAFLAGAVFVCAAALRR